MRSSDFRLLKPVDFLIAHTYTYMCIFYVNDVPPRTVSINIWKSIQRKNLYSLLMSILATRIKYFQDGGVSGYTGSSCQLALFKWTFQYITTV